MHWCRPGIITDDPHYRLYIGMTIIITLFWHLSLVLLTCGRRHRQHLVLTVCDHGLINHREDRCIIHNHWTDFVSNNVVRSRMGQSLLWDIIRQRRLSFFGHLCRADNSHSRTLRACIRGPPKDWRRRTGRPRQTWLRTAEDDLRPFNFGLATARRRAMDRLAWRLLVDVATSSWHAPERDTGEDRLDYRDSGRTD